jgi:formylglycine-generating enzyme required for sulfatase activity
MWMAQQKDGLPISREPEYPVVGINWEDAQAFCDWLTEKELREGTVPRGAKYRLPTDAEWSWAVGLAKEEGATPAERSDRDQIRFPWGVGYPPPRSGIGNYADTAWHARFPDEPWLEGYSDGYPTTSPVGSFPPNSRGLNDVGGNVWEWCEDWFDGTQLHRTLRGASWYNGDARNLLSSHRFHDSPESRHGNYGFRCVLDLSAASKPGGASSL